MVELKPEEEPTNRNSGTFEEEEGTWASLTYEVQEGRRVPRAGGRKKITPATIQCQYLSHSFGRQSIQAV